MASSSTQARPCPEPTNPANYVFAFGDSYTSTSFDVSGSQPSACEPFGNPPYPGRTTSSGPNWLDLVVSHAPPNTLAYNLAQGGATVNVTLAWLFGAKSNFVTQTAQFQELYARPNRFWTSNNSMFIIWFGVNDINGGFDRDEDGTLTDQIMDSYWGLVQNLYDEGARHFTILGIAPIWEQPFWSDPAKGKTVELGKIRAEYWNMVLEQRFSQFQSSHSEASMQYVDTWPFFDRILQSPRKYCAPDNQCQNPDGSCLWMDGIHAGKQLHQSLGFGVFNAMTTNGWWKGSPTNLSFKPLACPYGKLEDSSFVSRIFQPAYYPHVFGGTIILILVFVAFSAVLLRTFGIFRRKT